MMGSLTNLQLRVLSGLVLAILVLGLTWLGGFPFRLLCVAIGAAVYVEWRKIVSLAPNTFVRIAEFGLAAAFAAILAGLSDRYIFALIAAAVFLGFITVWAGKARAWLPVGIAYAAIPAAALSLLRADDEQGLFAILFLFAIVWSTDVFAYFVGRSMGGAKLAPSISPNKTWSGAIGGTAAAVAAGLAVAAIFGPVGNAILPIAIIFISMFSQGGDLFESWTKRKFGVKDSGTLIPGHGGVMDRVDGLAAAAVALYLLFLAGSSF